MATWVTHLMIADQILAAYPALDRRGYCVGNIAPDCNVENADWTAFTPPREVTHWMGDKRKSAADCDRFLKEYLLPRLARIESSEEFSFLLGYYSHLIADAEFQRFIQDEDRVRAVWMRIKENDELRKQAAGLPETWDTVKKLISKKERRLEFEAIEWEYLREHPDSGYLTEILPLTEFPDYIDYLPSGSIVRKIPLMKLSAATDASSLRFIDVSREEYAIYVQNAASLVLSALKTHNFIQSKPRQTKGF